MKLLPFLFITSLFSTAVLAVDSVSNQPEKMAAEELMIVGGEMNKLSKTGASFALETIQKNAKLAPFALILNTDDSISKLEALAPFVKKAPTREKINYLRGQIKNFAELGKIKAGAVFSRGLGRTSSITDEVVGLIIEQEHVKGISTIQFVPYENKNGQIKALTATSNVKPKLFFNEKISSHETYKQIKQAVAQAQK